MKMRKGNKSFLVLATGLFLILSFDPTPSGSAVPTSSPRLDPDEIRALEEVSSWLAGSTDGLAALTPEDLTHAAASTPLAFELFRHYTDEGVRRQQLLRVPFGREISRAADRHEVDGLLLAAMVEVESGFRADVVSPQGAVGLLQVMPATGARYSAQDLLDPRTNLDVGSRYLSSLLKEFDGNLDLTLAAYNAGPGNVLRYGGIPPFRETRDYVGRVLSLYVGHHRDVWEASGAKDVILFR